jgi:hypothetical protein
MKKIVNPWIAVVLAVFQFGCASVNPITLGDQTNAKEYGYHPLDPLPVEIKYNGDSTDPKRPRLMSALPDETMRLAIGEVLGEGGISYATAKTGYKGRDYVVTLDYIKFTTKSIPVTVVGKLPNNDNIPAYKIVAQGTPDVTSLVPVYVGVGLRLTASITVNEGTVDLGNLFGIGAAASAKKISGTLVVQSLGISGENISAALPMPAEINSTTIQNAILALGTIKSKLYEEKTIIIPRVVGIYNNLGGGSKTINNFISMLLKENQILEVE